MNTESQPQRSEQQRDALMSERDMAPQERRAHEAQRSEQQEWSGASLEKFIRMWGANLTAERINAALTAERQRHPSYETVLEALDILTKAYDVAGQPNTFVALATRAAAERQRCEQAEEKNSAQVNTFRLLGDALGISPQNEFTDELFVAVANLKQQLLSALAAIKKLAQKLESEAANLRAEWRSAEEQPTADAWAEKLDEITAELRGNAKVDLSLLHESRQK